MSNISIKTRKNAETGVSEEYILTTGTLIDIESTSKETKTNKKKYGFFSAEVLGRVSTGIAYDAVVAGKSLKAGDKVQVEILRADAIAGFNNRWKLALPSAEAISDDITKFLQGLK